MKCAMTSMNSKIISKEKKFFAEMVVEAVEPLDENKDKMDIGIFNKIVETNKSVNDQVDAFNKKLMEVQVEFQKAKFEARAKTN